MREDVTPAPQLASTESRRPPSQVVAGAVPGTPTRGAAKAVCHRPDCLPRDRPAARRVPRLHDRRAGPSKVHDPARDGADTQPQAELVAEVATVLRECVVGGNRPVAGEKLDELQHLALSHVGAAHAHALAVVVSLAAPWSAAEDPKAPSIFGVAEAPLTAVDLNAAVEGAGAQRSQEPVQRLPHLASSDVVDVQRHRLWRVLGPHHERFGRHGGWWPQLRRRLERHRVDATRGPSRSRQRMGNVHLGKRLDQRRKLLPAHISSECLQYGSVVRDVALGRLR
mmetsp:Transcript_81984/g.244543  ORF Transcript_81984/g.244543 Transcript_81984/m.244543 type:complete len:282 (-) Transcript_81984:256-1101(-)